MGNQQKEIIINNTIDQILLIYSAAQLKYKPNIQLSE